MPATLPRRFKSPGNTPVAAIAALSSTVALGDPHPETGAVRASNYRVIERIGSGAEVGYIIEVDYTPAGGNFQFPSTDRGRDGFVARETRSEESTITVPIIARQRIYVPDNAPPPAIAQVLTGNKWIKHEISVPVSSLEYQVTFNFPAGLWDQGAVFSADDQTNAIHLFGGRYWLFLGAASNASTFREGFYEITYRWKSEKGTPDSAFDEITTDQGPIPWPTDGSLLRPPSRDPFGTYFTYTKDTAGPPPPGYDVSILTTPVIAVTVPFARIDNGHTFLPGYGSYWSV